MAKYRYLLIGLFCVVLAGAVALLGHHSHQNAAIWEMGIAPPVYSEIEDRYQSLKGELSGEEAEVAEQLFGHFAAGDANAIHALCKERIDNREVSSKLAEFADYLREHAKHFVDQSYVVLCAELPDHRHADAKEALELYESKDGQGLADLRKKMHHLGDENSMLIVGFIDVLIVDLRASSQQYTFGIGFYITAALLFLIGLGLCVLWARSRSLDRRLHEEGEGQ